MIASASPVHDTVVRSTFRAMTPEKRSAVTIVASGLAFSATAFLLNGLLAPGPRVAQALGFAIGMGGAIVLLGCIVLARAKGQPWYFGPLGAHSAHRDRQDRRIVISEIGHRDRRRSEATLFVGGRSSVDGAFALSS